jgi:hypothetical protein
VNEQVLDRILPMLAWRCASLARGLAPKQPIDLLRHTEGRQRVQPTLLEGYLSGKVIGSLVDDVITISAGLPGPAPTVTGSFSVDISRR